MRVLMLVGRAAGGVGAHVDRLVAGLGAAGHDVVLVTASSTADRFGWDDAHRLWPVHPGVRAPRGLVDWHRVMRLAATVDVVHAHGHQAAVVAAAAVARARPTPRLVVSLHNDLPPRTGSVWSRRQAAIARAAIARALRHADLVTGASGDLVQLAELLGARRTELAPVTSAHVAGLLQADPLPPDARTRLLKKVGVPADRPVVLTVSRIAPQKDLATLVDAARLSGADASWVVVGDGDPLLRRRLEDAADGIRRQGRSDEPATGARVHFVGAHDDVTQWLRCADVFALTSRWEARALVVQEAMAAGLPVVATRTGGLPDLLHGAGVLVPVADPAATAAAVDALLADPDRRAALATAGRTLAASWQTPQDGARRWVERYARVTGGMT